MTQKVDAKLVEEMQKEAEELGLEFKIIARGGETTTYNQVDQKATRIPDDKTYIEVRYTDPSGKGEINKVYNQFLDKYQLQG